VNKNDILVSTSTTWRTHGLQSFDYTGWTSSEGIKVGNADPKLSTQYIVINEWYIEDSS